jgi:hypothetical protein
MKIEERFTDTGVNVRVPLGPTGPEERKDNFLQRDGVPIIVINAIRESDKRSFEVSLPFVMANDTPPETIQSLLVNAKLSIEYAERQTHGN